MHTILRTGAPRETAQTPTYIIFPINVHNICDLLFSQGSWRALHPRPARVHVKCGIEPGSFLQKVLYLLLSQSAHLMSVSASHTGSSAFLRPPPALSNACCMYGPTTGMLLAKPPIVAKKSPKSTNIPYSSTKKPTSGHRSNMSIMPTANAAVPFNFCRRAKKIAVFCRPIMRVRPTRNSI